MKNLSILFALLTLLTFSACKKNKCDFTCYNGGICNENTGQCMCTGGYTGRDCSNSPSPCVLNHFGSVIVSSTHSDSYYIYINGVYKGTQGYGAVTYPNISSGYVTIRQEQVNYVFFQNTYTENGNLSDCGTLIATF